MTLEADIVAMCGAWHDVLSANEVDGSPIAYDPHGGVAGPFPYENLVYVSFEQSTGAYTQTNVTFRGRETHARTFEADVADGVLRFRKLGPEAPEHVGVSAGVGLIWFVSESTLDDGLRRYCEPDFIRLTGDQRTRDTVLWRDGTLVRTLHVDGTRLTIDESTRHALDPRGADGPVHELRSSTTHYLGTQS